MKPMFKTDDVKHVAGSGGKTPMTSTYNATCDAGHSVVVTDAGFSATTVRVASCPCGPAHVVRKSAAPQPVVTDVRHRDGFVVFVR